MLTSYLLLIFVISGVFAAPLSAQENFYRGKTLRLVVGYSAGGGFDVYSRAISRHIGRHIPGSPSAVVENLTGAGSVVAANHVLRAAKPDGLTIGNVNGGLFVQQLLGWPGIEFDAAKFEHLGVPVKDKAVCAMTKASGIASYEKWAASKVPIKLGATGPGSATHNVPLILKEALGLPIQLVSGYKGMFVGPDNGLLTPVLDGADIVSLPIPGTAAPTFHGRDVFAPAAAALANGTALQELDRPVPDPFRLPLPEPELRGGDVHGTVTCIDRIGTLVTNVPGALVPAHAVIWLGDRAIGPIRRTFSDVPPHALVAFIGSGGRLEVARRDGSAAGLLRAEVGSPVRVAVTG